MNDDLKTKLSYIPAQARIRLVISKAACDDSPTPPEDLIQRAIERMDQSVADGTLAFYNLYRDRLERLWTAFRSARFKPDKKIAVTLAAGAPPMPEVQLTAAEDPFLAYLTIHADADKISAWKFEFLKLTVQRRMSDIGITRFPDPSLLQAVYLRALRGKPARNVPLIENPHIPELVNEQFQITTRGAYGDLVLVIYNVAYVATESARTSIIEWISGYIEAARKAQHKNYLFLKDDVESRLKSFARGPERLGIDLPTTILTALSEGPAAVERVDLKGTGKAGQTRTVQLNFDPEDYFRINVATDRMSAQLVVTNRHVFDDPQAVTQERLMSFLKSNHIVHGVQELAHENLMAVLTRKQMDQPVTVALGTAAVQAQEPFLWKTWQDGPYEPGPDTEVLPPRRMQSRSMVHKGETIAEVQYRRPAVPGKDIFGHPVTPPEGEVPTFETGDNVESLRGRKFIARMDGVPLIDGNRISLEKVLVFAGNVHALTGQVIYDGHAVIEGSVERGAYIRVTGDLEVKGTIEESVIVCGGTLRVSGILSGPAGMIRVRGDIHADFINNARIECRGSCYVKGNLTSTQLMVGKTLEISVSDTWILGGHTAFGALVKCHHLGRANGQITEIQGGSDPFLVRRHSMLQKRLDGLTRSRDELRKQYRHLAALKPEQTTRRHLRAKQGILERIQRVTEIAEKLEARLTAVSGTIHPVEDARIEVQGTLSTNCRITLNGKTIQPEHEVAAVRIQAKRARGTHILPLAEDKSGKDIGETPKKAS